MNWVRVRKTGETQGKHSTEGAEGQEREKSKREKASAWRGKTAGKRCPLQWKSRVVCLCEKKEWTQLE